MDDFVDNVKDEIDNFKKYSKTAIKNFSALFTSNCQHWAIPSNLYNAFLNCGFIDMCPLKSSVDLFNRHYENKRLFCNPPFNELSKWVDYLVECSKFNNDIFLLMPARTDTKYFHKLISCLYCNIYFIEGRLHFNDCKKVAPIPTLLIHIGAKPPTLIHYCIGISIDVFIDSLYQIYKKD